MGTTSPNGRVAAVVPVYSGRFLAEALESIFFQSRPPDEVVVVDDGSPDPLAIRRAVAPYGRRATVVVQRNQGAAAARNAGIAATSAEFIALLDADDRWLPHFLLEQMESFTADPTLDMIYADGLFVGETPLAGRRFMAACPSDGAVTLEALLAQRCTVLLSSVVTRRDALVAVGGFDVSLRRGHDFDLWLRMARRGARMRYRRDVLVLYRRHEDALSGTGVAEIERPLRVLRKARETMTLTAKERRTLDARVQQLEGDLARERAKELLSRGDFIGARRAFADACRQVRGWKLQGARLAMYVMPRLVRRVYLTRSVVTSS